MLGFLSTVFVSLVASVLAVMMVNRVNLAKIKFIKDLTDSGAVKTVLTNLKSYGGRYSESKHVELVFEHLKEGLEGLTAIKVTQTVRVRMPIQRKELIIDFVKLDRSGGPAGDSITYDLQSDAVPDDAQSIDVTDIKRCFPTEYESMFPGLVEVIVASRPCRVAPEYVDDRKNHRRWRIDTKRHVGAGLVDVVYKFSYYQEATGFAYQEVSEPTHGFLYSLNYEGVADDISVYRIGGLNARESGQDVRKREHQVEVATSEWVVPSTLIVFSWYQKKNQSKAGGADSARAAASTAEPATPPEQPSADELSWPDPGASGLSVDGNCLGVALLDLFAALSTRVPESDLQAVSTPTDAIATLRLADVDTFILPRFHAFARPVFALQSWLFRVPLAEDAILADGEVALCLRSMRQLYGLRRAEAHWVTIVQQPSGPVVIDRLAKSVRETFLGVREASAQEILEAAGFTLKVRRK